MGIIHRLGLGKLRHIDTHALWVQQAAVTKRIRYEKVAGAENPADAFTKHLSEPIRDIHFKVCAVQYLEGRLAAAPALCKS